MLVEQVCVADGGLSHELLAATVRFTEERLLTAARRAVGSGLLVAVGEGYAFRHELIRQAVYWHLLPGERRRLHRRLAETLATRPGSDPGRLAQHWHLAGCPDRAAPAAVAAARAAVLARAYPEALRCYAMALDLQAWLAEAGQDLVEAADQDLLGEGQPLLEEAAQVASWAGDARRAAEWAARALALCGTEGADTTLRARAAGAAGALPVGGG